MKKALALLLILVLCLSFGYASIESVHECHDETECPICRIIAVLTNLFAVTMVCFVSAVCFALILSVSNRERSRESNPSTPIDLCVKLLN